MSDSDTELLKTGPTHDFKDLRSYLSQSISGQNPDHRSKLKEFYPFISVGQDFIFDNLLQ